MIIILLETIATATVIDNNEKLKTGFHKQCKHKHKHKNKHQNPSRRNLLQVP